jgi:NAD-dependent SIR2 family protein deacetylase
MRTSKLRPRVGKLFPAVELYNSSSSNDDIPEIMTHDIREGPDLLCVMGTSLSIPDLTKAIKIFAKEVKEHGGLTVFVNKEPPRSQWHKVFDYHVMDEVDACVHQIALKWRQSKEDDWALNEAALLDKPVRDGHDSSACVCGYRPFISSKSYQVCFQD